LALFSSERLYGKRGSGLVRSSEKNPTDCDRAGDGEFEFHLEMRARPSREPRPEHVVDVDDRDDLEQDEIPAAERARDYFRRAHLPSDAQHWVVGWRVGSDRLEACRHGKLTALAEQGALSAVSLDLLGNVAMRHHHETHSAEDRGIVAEGTQLVEPLPARSRAQLFDDSPTEPAPAMFSIYN
jgi:hypothetical protein